MNTILFAPVYSRSGYGDHAREVVEFILSETSIKLSIVPVSWGKNQDNYYTHKSSLIEKINDRIVTKLGDKKYDCCITVGMPGEFKNIGNYNIGITAGIETNRVSKEFIYHSNLMDLLVVPSKFTRDTFENTHYINDDQQKLELECEICVVNEYATQEFYSTEHENKPTNILSSIHEDFCFLSVGQWTSSSSDDGGRKNITSLIKTFLKTFNDSTNNKPALVLKTNGCNFSFTDKNNIENLIREAINQYGGNVHPNIYLIHGSLNSVEMHGLYTDKKIKAFVTHSKGEGFGRPLLESALCELPIICPNFGGYLDFLNENNSYLVNGSLEEVGLTNNLFCENAKWMQIDEDESSKAMLDVFQNYDSHKSKISNNLNEISSNFSSKSAFEKYKNIFRNIDTL